MWRRFRAWLNRLLPQHQTWSVMGRAWRWAGTVLLLALGLAGLSQAFNLYGLFGIAAALGLLVLAAAAVWLLLLGIARLAPGARWGLLLLAAPLYPLALNEKSFAAFYLVLLTLLGLLAVGVSRLRNGRALSGRVYAILGGVPLLTLMVGFWVSGWQVETAAVPAPVAGEPLRLPDPGRPGEHDVIRLSYGSGSDLHREAFAAGADWRTDPVDGSKLLEGWDGLAGWTRSGFWGFGPDALPLQGRVWLPSGDGPFPLALIVHGNHEMSDFSDVGYDYLGKLFASRGIITVSVDENFLNSSFSDLIGGPEAGLEEESDARAWLLLEHLAAWRDWSADPDHPMSGKVDLDRVLLIGHSRGGEAVSEAAVFNHLSRYPDDGTLAFNFNFGIRGVIAIAPVDHQYNPRDRDTQPRDLSYLVIHGSHDSDVTAFAGSALYSRLALADCESCFKSAFYLLNANHGQFNTAWGRYDLPLPFSKLLNVAPLLDGTAQRRVASVLFSAFAETLLHDRREYQRFLARPELGQHWFPEGTAFLSNYADGNQVILADFEEDDDLQSATAPGVRIRGSGFSLWKEAEVPLRWRDLDSAAVLIGWQGDAAEPQPVYELQLADSIWLKPAMALSFAAAMSAESPGGVEDYVVPETLDFVIELEDAAGNLARVSLSDLRVLSPPTDPVLYKIEWLDDEAATETVFQRYVYPLHQWMAVQPDLDISSLTAIRFLFPTDTPASVWLDDLRISKTGL